MRKSLLPLAAALISIASLSLGTSARAADQVENPQYQAWAKYGVGSSETLEGAIEAGANKVTTRTKRTLIEKAADHVVVEVVISVNFMGTEHAGAPSRQTIGATVEKQEIGETVTESVTAAGKTFECKVYEASQSPGKAPATGPAAGAKGKLWVAEGVPGGIVKMEATVARGTLTSTLTSFEAK